MLRADDKGRPIDIRVGDTVTIQRAGDVIPQVLSVDLSLRPKGAKPFEFPKICPCPVKTAVVREETATGGEGIVRRCSGEFACPFQRKEHLRHFVARQAFDIEGLGEKQIEYFYESEDLPVKAPADIFTLRKRNAKNTHKLEDVDGFGEVSVRNLFDAIDARREIPLDRFLNALGIRHVGETTAKVLARAYGSWQAFHDAALTRCRRAMQSAAEEMDAIDQIGATVVEAIGRYFGESHNRGLVEDLTKEVNVRRCRAGGDQLAGRRENGRLHRVAGTDEPGRSQGYGGAARCQGFGLGFQEDRPRRGRARARGRS